MSAGILSLTIGRINWQLIELAKLTKEMKALAKKYKEAKGADKDKIVADLKEETKLKKELEAMGIKVAPVKNKPLPSAFEGYCQQV